MTPHTSPQTVLENNMSLLRTQPSGRTGILPRILFQAVQNTVPYLFVSAGTRMELPHCGNVEGAPINPHGPCPILKIWNDQLALGLESLEVFPTHLEYFKLCLASHWLTCASFVPTDVDNLIRFKLWDSSLDLETLESMAEQVLKVRQWPETAFASSDSLLSKRWLVSPLSKAFLSGHQGEWFSVAAAAYACMRTRNQRLAAQIQSEILELLEAHVRIFEEFRRANDGVNLLRATAAIAHNLGDLDRVIDQWKIPNNDPLKQAVFKLGHDQSGSRPLSKSLLLAESLYKARMADENHRHFALRKPRGLRRSYRFIIGTGPFFDDWGRMLSNELRKKNSLLTETDIAEIVEALIDGWTYLKQVPKGYPRALAGILETFPGGLNSLLQVLPSRVGRTLKSGELRILTTVSQSRFEEQWKHFGNVSSTKSR